MNLHVDFFGPAEAATDRRPLLLVHGLFGSGKNLSALAKRLAEGRRVAVVDQRNHGQSPWSPVHTYSALAEDLAQMAAELGQPVDLIGHSMGGKAAMTLALTAPEAVARLIVADIAPVAYDHTQLPLIEAMRRLDLTAVTRRAQADAHLRTDIDDPGVRAFLLQSLDLRASPPRWRLNLDALADQMPEILGWPDTLEGAFQGSTLFLSGGASDYVRPEHRARIKALFPAARFMKIPGASHWLHADKPVETAAAMVAFLNA